MEIQNRNKWERVLREIRMESLTEVIEHEAAVQSSAEALHHETVFKLVYHEKICSAR